MYAESWQGQTQWELPPERGGKIAVLPNHAERAFSHEFHHMKAGNGWLKQFFIQEGERSSARARREQARQRSVCLRQAERPVGVLHRTDLAVQAESCAMRF